MVDGDIWAREGRGKKMANGKKKKADLELKVIL